MQYTIGLATQVPVTFISAGDVGFPSHDEFTDWLLDTAHYMLALPSPPQVMTTSYGDNEENISGALAECVPNPSVHSRSGANRAQRSALCTAYAALGARGVSVLFGSGDGGVSGIQPEFITPQCTTFVPTFPSVCPLCVARLRSPLLIPLTLLLQPYLGRWHNERTRDGSLLLQWRLL